MMRLIDDRMLEFSKWLEHLGIYEESTPYHATTTTIRGYWYAIGNAMYIEIDDEFLPWVVVFDDRFDTLVEYHKKNILQILSLRNPTN